MFPVALSYDICSVIRGRDASNTGSGPEFFGFSHPTIQYLIQSLPGARKCSKYQWVKFELPKPPQNKQGKRSDYTKLLYQILQVIVRNLWCCVGGEVEGENLVCTKQVDFCQIVTLKDHEGGEVSSVSLWSERRTP